MSDDPKPDDPSASKIEEVQAPPANPTPDPPAPAHVAVPHTAASEGDSELKGVVESLAKTVEGLVQAVAGLAGQADVSPAKVPWTHRGGRR